MQFGHLTLGRQRPFVRSAGVLTPMQEQYLKGARRLARLMDAQWGIGPLRFGVEAIVGLVPGFGDVLSGVASVYLLWAARQLGVPRKDLSRMVAITVLDLGIGLVPFLGDAADTVFKSHMRNLAVIEQHVSRGDGNSVRIRSSSR